MNYRVELFFIICLTSETVHSKPRDPRPYEPLIEFTENITLGFTGDLDWSTVKSHNSRVMCTIDGFGIDREGKAKFRMEDVNPTLCTHLIFRYVSVSDDNGTLRFVPPNNITNERSEEMYSEVVRLKKQNSDLKMILSFAAWNVSAKDFQNITAYKNMRRISASNIVQFLKPRGFDGVNLEQIVVTNKDEEVSNRDVTTEPFHVNCSGRSKVIF